MYGQAINSQLAPQAQVSLEWDRRGLRIKTCSGDPAVLHRPECAQSSHAETNAKHGRRLHRGAELQHRAALVSTNMKI